MTFKRILIALSSLLIVLIVGAVIWYQTALAALDSTSKQSITFTVDAGEDVGQIARELQEKGIIKSALAFEAYATLHGDRAKLQAGVYELSPSQKVGDVVRKIVSGDVLKKRLTIPEGTTLAKLKDLAAAQGISRQEVAAALGESFSYSFLATKPAAVDLEGYLFPDSYNLDPSTTGWQLVKLMLDTFDKRVTAEYTAAFQARGMTLHEGLTLASIIEKEVSNAADRPIVSQVFNSRLKAGQALESDVTIDYAAALAGKSFSLNLDSPYNTYRNKGLPPGPICNPGLSALNAAAHPATTDYTYFLAGKDGKTHFAKTFAEHEANIAKYLK